jgi:hypothetical protein
MLYRILILLFVAAVAVVDLDAQSKAKTKAATPPVEEEGPPAMAVPPSYRYERRGRRDPFINPVPKPMVTEDMPAPVIRPPGLKGVLVSEATVSAVVTSKETATSVAVISTPAGKTYFARSGDPLFDAVIKEIRPDGVVFALSTPGRESTTAPREIERKVRQTPGAN